MKYWSSTSSPMPAIWPRWRRSPPIRAIASCSADICDPGRCARPSRPSSPTGSCIWPPRAMSIARSTGPASSSRPMSSALTSCCRRRCAYWRGARAARRRSFPLPSHLHRRSLRLARAGRPVPRGHALCAQFALFRLQGRLRPSGARLAPHLRAAGRRDQLLQQLRPLSISRKADPADHPQRPGRQAAAGLWRRREHPRLAVRRGSCRGSADRGRTGPDRRELQHRRHQRARAISMSSTPFATWSTNWRPTRKSGRAANSSPTSPTAPATICATPSTAPRSSANSAGGRARPSRPACARRCNGISTIEPWWGDIRSGRYRGERLGDA